MKFSFTSGETYEIPDMCTCCEMTTGGEHQPHCPCYQPLNAKTREQKLREIMERSHIKYGEAWQKLADGEAR